MPGREARRSTSAPHLCRVRPRAPIPEQLLASGSESEASETTQDSSHQDSTDTEGSGTELKRKSRIQRDATGRRIIKGNTEKVAVNVPEGQTGRPDSPLRRNPEPPAADLPEGYSDWDEVAGDDLDIEMLKHIRARKMLEEAGKKILAKIANEGLAPSRFL